MKKKPFYFRLINGLIEVDRKLLLYCSSLPPSVSMERSLSKFFWDAFIAAIFTYFLSFQLAFAKTFTFYQYMQTHVMDLLFHSPNIIIIVVLFITCYFLYNLGNMFCKLNSLWKSLSPGLVDSTGRWNTSEITQRVECIRLLHAELSELLRLFSLSYGQVHLIYFFICATNNIVALFLIIIFKNASQANLGILPIIFFIQHAVFIISVLYISTWVIDKVMIAYM